jgi:DNA-binding transcriptional MerR regulator/methylmalonyl-CoA mutase cobalamin-binding subunit
LEGFYQISDLARLSGIKAHTIRIWEKRYGLIVPFRTDTNIRYYDDAQLKRLLNVASLVDHGHKISHVAAMSEAAVKAAMIDTAPQAQQDYVRELIRAMIDFDELSFGKVLEAVMNAMRPEEGITGVIYPFLEKVGMLWRIDDARPVQEHFASGMIRRKLIAMIDRMPMSEKGKTFLLFLPDGEWHEIGLLVAEFMLRSYGAKVINLGQSVPFEDISFMLQKINPDRVFTILTHDSAEKIMEAVDRIVSKKKGQMRLLVAGSSLRVDYLKDRKYCSILKEPKEILMFL